MSRRRTERLVNLVLCLLSTRWYLTAAQIADIVPGYEHDASDPKEHEAFQRMFERDKAELRDLGVPLETGTNSVFDTESGYRIARRDYALPEVRLDPDEAAAVGLAAQLWHHAGLSSAASSGLLKLRAGGVELGEGPPLGIEPVVRAEPALTPLLTAINARRVVEFDYRAVRDGTARRRTLQPWGAVCWRGRWYVVGHDLDRDGVRCFRLSRVTGPVTAVGRAGAFTPPEGVDLAAHVEKFASEPARRGQARIRVRAGAAAGLRRWAEAIEPAADSGPGTDPGAAGGGPAPGPDDWDVLRLNYSDPEALAARLAAYGSAAVVLDPPEVRTAVIRRLTRIARDTAAGAATGAHPSGTATPDGDLPGPAEPAGATPGAGPARRGQETTA